MSARVSQNGALAREQLGDFQRGLFEHEWLFSSDVSL